MVPYQAYQPREFLGQAQVLSMVKALLLVQTGQFQSTKSNTVWTSDPFDVSLYTSLNISATLTSSDVDANDNLKVEVYVDDTPTQVYYGTSAATSIVEVSIPDGSQAYIEITANTDAKFDTYKWTM